MKSASWMCARFLVAFVALSLTLWSGVSLAAAPSSRAAKPLPVAGVLPVIDGNGDDLINYAAAIGSDICAVDVADPRDDISFPPKSGAVPCAVPEDTDGNAVPDYFVNGMDLRRYVAAYNGTDLYILFRSEGLIGDLDGNGNPDNNLCLPTIPNIPDANGIGLLDSYQTGIDVNCDGSPDILINVTNNAVTVTGITTGATSFAFRQDAPSGATGKDLEVLIEDILLPASYRIFGFAGSQSDFLGEDLVAEQLCGAPNPVIDIEKSVLPAVICVGQTADFTLTVTNTGNVDLTDVTVTDNLPAGLTFQSTETNTCFSPIKVAGGPLIYGPFNLAKGASCTIVIRAARTADCDGNVTNQAHVDATFQLACFNGGEPVTVSDDADATVLCGNVTCEITAPDTHVCPGETVEICGPKGPFTYLWSPNDETDRCIIVGPGTYSLVITNTVTGCSSVNKCTVTITEDPRPTCSIEALDRNVCPGETVEICGPKGFGYLWSPGGETTRCINVGAGTYSLVITDLVTGCASDNKCSVTIIEDPRPTCSIEALDRNVCPGETVEICGPKGFGYLWSPGGETTRCINVGAGTYSLVITDLVTGCSSDNKCSVTIIEDPGPTCSIEALDRSVCPGETVEICGPKGFDYLWSPGGETTRCINVGGGTYSLVITDPTTGCSSNNECSVTIIEDPRPSCTITASGTRVCPGGTVELCGPAGLEYLWSPGGETTRCITVGAGGPYSLVTTDPDTRCVSNTTCSVTVFEDPCVGLCRITGGGCLNEPGNNQGHKDHTFGGNVSPAHTGGGPTGNEWQHVVRSGRTILFNFHSHDAHIVECTVVPPGPCSPPAVNTRADFEGTCKFSIGSGTRDMDGNFDAYVIDHREGSCNPHARDEYSITVRSGLVQGEGTIVFQISGTIDCGNLQIHELPPPVLAGRRGTQTPDLVEREASTEAAERIAPQGPTESLALLNRVVPNPFTGTMSYAYEVTGQQSQPVEISVYNVAGRLVRPLARTTQGPGRYTVTWDGTDQRGERVATGVYFLHVRLGAERKPHRVVYLGR